MVSLGKTNTKSIGITYKEMYRQFCECSPEYACMIEDYRPCGKYEIMIWLNDGRVYRVRYHDKHKFSMLLLSADNIRDNFD